jgi:hypothetical protein
MWGDGKERGKGLQTCEVEIAGNVPGCWILVPGFEFQVSD